MENVTAEPPEYLNESAVDSPVDPRILMVDRLGHGTIIPIICLVGMILNVLNMLVLLSRRLSESTYTYLMGLALADFFSLLLFGVNGVGRGYYKGHYSWTAFEVYVYFPFGMITTTTSILITITLTAERLVFIYKPHRAKFLCRQTIARRLTAALCVISSIYNIPRFFVFRIEDQELAYTEFGVSDFYTYLSYFYFCSISVGSSIALIVMNVLLIRGIQKSHQRRRMLTSQNNLHVISSHQRQEEMRLTRTVISIIFVFIIGEVPSSFLSRTAVVAILGHGNEEFLKTYGYKLAACCATGLVVSQHSLNFVIYCVFNRRFWMVFKHKWRCWCSSGVKGPAHVNGDMRSEQHMLASVTLGDATTNDALDINVQNAIC